MEILSPAFENNGGIPRKYTCDGENINPPLEIVYIPQSAKSLILGLREQNDNGRGKVHWLVLNIDPSVKSIEEGESPIGAIISKNDFGKNNYQGPCSNDGAGCYIFRVYALNCKLELSANMSFDDLIKEAKGNVMDSAELIGFYTHD
jgi:Raf kinase inhibitor-like YbhB/YbcL family protein